MNSDFVDTPIQIRYGDLDSRNHVNNATYLTYMEMGRLDYFRKNIGDFFFRDNSFLLARIEIDYLQMVLLEDTLTCRTWIEKVGNSSIVLGNILFKGDNTLCAKATSVAVMTDLNGKKINVPEEIRKLIAHAGSMMYGIHQGTGGTK